MPRYVNVLFTPHCHLLQAVIVRGEEDRVLFVLWRHSTSSYWESKKPEMKPEVQPEVPETEVVLTQNRGYFDM